MNEAIKNIEIKKFDILRNTILSSEDFTDIHPTNGIGLHLTSKACSLWVVNIKKYAYIPIFLLSEWNILMLKKIEDLR